MSIFYNLFKKNLYNTPETLYEGLKKESDPALMVLMDKITPYALAQGKRSHLSEDEIQSIVLAAVTIQIECLRSGDYQFIVGKCPSHFAKKTVDNLIRHTWRKKKSVSWDDAHPIAEGVTPDTSERTDTSDNDKTAPHNDLKIVVTDEREIFENREIVHKALAQLSEAEQNLLLQTYQEGYSDEDLLLQQEKVVNREHKEQLRQARKRARFQFQYWWLYYMARLTPAESPKFNKTKDSRETVARNYTKRLESKQKKRNPKSSSDFQ